MMAVPVDESRRRLLGHATIYPAVAAGLSIYGGFWEREATVERSYTIPVKGLGAGAGYRLAQISDIHLGSFFSVAELDKLLRRVAAQKPDMLAITGDLFDDVTQNEKPLKSSNATSMHFPMASGLPSAITSTSAASIPSANTSPKRVSMSSAMRIAKYRARTSICSASTTRWTGLISKRSARITCSRP